MASVLEVKERLQTQSTAEQLAWQLDTSTRGTPTSPAVASVKQSDGTNVKSTVMPSGSPSVTNNIITLPVLKLLTAGERYEIRTTFTAKSNKQEIIINVDCPL